MATLSREKRKDKSYFRIQFADRDDQRKSIRLGAISRKDAEAIRGKVEDLISSSFANSAIRPETQVWLSGLGKDLHGKIARAGLIPPRQTATLAKFVDGYIAGRRDYKENTTRNHENSRQWLTKFFGETKELHKITKADAFAWRQFLVSEGLTSATISMLVKHCKKFFRQAIRENLIDENPFDELAAGSDANPSRIEFVDRERIQKVIDAAPDAEWKLIIALARYGGLRIPSELAELRWSDIDWEHERFTVTSPKTARSGKPKRSVPIFPELRPYFEAMRDAADDDSGYILQRRRSTNLRSQLLRFIGRAGVKPWPRVFQNLRASRETELTNVFPLHVAAGWIGNSAAVAKEHYLSTTEDHFTQAVRPAPETDVRSGSQEPEVDEGGAECGAPVVQNAVQQAAAPKCTEAQERNETQENTGVSFLDALSSIDVHLASIPPRGVEPLLPD